MRTLPFCKIPYSLILTTLLLITPVFSASGGEDGKNLWQPTEGAELIGKPAPGLSGLTWLNSGPLRIEDLRGKVVLIRFWLVGCPYCENTAPALAGLHGKYGGDGLVVIGIHHPKSERTKDDALVLKAAKGLGFGFPVA